MIYIYKGYVFTAYIYDNLWLVLYIETVLITMIMMTTKQKREPQGRGRKATQGHHGRAE